MEKKTLFIPNISCGHCIMTIQRELGELNGIKKVEGDPQTKKIEVSYDAPADLDKIKQVLMEINFPSKEEK
ncbi:MAG: copper chaperone [Desulfobacteraceae bacterium]|nr:MAG: copper chaperone [Desulfobacteraceae bacterium]